MKYYCPNHPTQLLFDSGNPRRTLEDDINKMFSRDVRAFVMPSSVDTSRVVVCPVDQESYYLAQCKTS